MNAADRPIGLKDACVCGHTFGHHCTPEFPDGGYCAASDTASPGYGCSCIAFQPAGERVVPRVPPAADALIAEIRKWLDEDEVLYVGSMDGDDLDGLAAKLAHRVAPAVYAFADALIREGLVAVPSTAPPMTRERMADLRAAVDRGYWFRFLPAVIEEMLDAIPQSPKQGGA